MDEITDAMVDITDAMAADIDQNAKRLTKLNLKPYGMLNDLSNIISGYISKPRRNLI